MKEWIRTLDVRALLLIILLLVVGHIIFDVYSATSSDNGNAGEVFTQGVQMGYEQAVIQLAQEVATCEQVPLILGNQSINVIAVACLG